MKFSKILIAFLLILATLMMSVACEEDSKKNNDDDDGSSTVDIGSSVESGDDSPEASDEVGNSASDTSSDDVSNDDVSGDTVEVELDFTIILEGKEYQIPCALGEFQADGWVIDDERYASSDGVMYYPGFNEFNMENGEKEILISVYNYGANAKPLSEWMVGEIKWNGKADGSVSGLTPYSSPEEVIAALGTPTKHTTGSDCDGIVYESTDGGKYIFSLEIDEREDYWSDITIERRFDEENIVITEEAPDFVKNYVAPTELGTDTFSGRISINGALYQFPIPVCEFIKNGWEVKEDYDAEYLIAGEEATATFTYGGVELEGTIVNYSPYMTKVENCIVSEIYFIDDENLKVELPGGFTAQSTFEDLQVLVNEDVNTFGGSFSYYSHETKYSIYYGYYDTGELYTLKISNEKLEELIH